MNWHDLQLFYNLGFEIYKRINKCEAKYSCYSNSKADVVIRNTNIDNQVEGLGWTFDSVKKITFQIRNLYVVVVILYCQKN